MMEPSASLLVTIALSRLLRGSAFSSHTCISAFDGNYGVHASDQENSSYDCKVAAINEKLGNGGGKEEKLSNRKASV